MLMECLSEGRAVSLPATGVAAAKSATGRWFLCELNNNRTPIADEGVQEKQLGR